MRNSSRENGAATASSTSIPESSDDDPTNPGFARLLERNASGDFCRWPIITDRCYKPYEGRHEKYSKGPSIRRVTYVGTLTRLIDRHLLVNAFRLVENGRPLYCLVRELVDAIRCPIWPPEAQEWTARRRLHEWPRKSDMEKVVNSGCYLVGKAHQNNPNDTTQWRLSFSNAEIVLIDSWNDVQKYIYHVLRLIKNEAVKTCGGDGSSVMCTYYLKTAMLWACEEKPPEFWEESNIERSVSELLCQVIVWLIDRNCPNYFIPSNNMINHLSKGFDLSGEITSILSHINSISSMVKKTPRAYSPLKGVVISLPDNVQCYLQSSALFDNLVVPSHPKMGRRFLERMVNSGSFLPELKFLYLGIRLQLECTRAQDGHRRNNGEPAVSSQALRCFDMAADAFRTGGASEIFLSLNDSASTCLKKWMLEDDANYFVSSENYIRWTGLEGIARIFGEHLPEPLRLISSAYTVNFLYATTFDYRSAVRCCDGTLNWFDAMMKITNVNYLNKYFPILVTSEWSGIFDKYIQAVFGFVTLYRNVFGQRCQEGSPFSCGTAEGVLRLPPLELLSYIRYQCLRKLGHGETSFRRYNLSDIPDGRSFYIYRDNEKFSHLFLCAAFEISSRKNA